MLQVSSSFAAKYMFDAPPPDPNPNTWRAIRLSVVNAEGCKHVGKGVEENLHTLTCTTTLKNQLSAGRFTRACAFDRESKGRAGFCRTLCMVHERTKVRATVFLGFICLRYAQAWASGTPHTQQDPFRGRSLPLLEGNLV